MGYEVEGYIDDIEECPKCKSKKFRVVTTTHQTAYADLENQEFSNFDYDDIGSQLVMVYCKDCNELIKEESY